MEKLKNDYYKLSAAEVLKRLKSHLLGLDLIEVKKRQIEYGPNKLREVLSFSIWKILFRQFSSPLVYILVFAAIITFSIGHFLDAWIIFGIVLFNVVIGFIQEYRAENASRLLKKLLIYKVKVKRDGQEQIINAEELVPGDIIVIRAGDKVGADVRILESQDLRVNEAVLTGESTLVEKNARELSGDKILAERSNLLFSGTSVISGEGKAVVVNIGEATEFGKIAESILKVEKILTPFQMRMVILGSWIIRAVLILGVLIVILGTLRGFDFLEMLIIATSTAVAAIPEGLPAVITIVLAIGVLRMAKENAIIRKLAGVETLGSISVIASDKTGTLTYGEMTTTKIYAGNGIYSFSGSGYNPKGKVFFGNQLLTRHNLNLKNLLWTGIACSSAQIYQDEHQEWQVDGDPTEAALIVAGEKIGIKKIEIEKNLPKICSIPFDTNKHYMATLHQDGSKNLLAVKGTIEKVLYHSTHYFDNGKILILSAEKKAAILKANHEFAENALRVLAIASKDVNLKQNKILEKDIENLVFLGLAGMIDAPRQEVLGAIQKAQEAGIKILMLTGDHKLTAAAVAKNLGLITGFEEVIEGEEMAKISETKLAEKLEHIRVFARISPQDKLKIVQLLQSRGEVVSVTGDGVNDAPALKQADIGIAMGKSGTDVAREAADLVLADDNFATIVTAIEEGRLVIHNIRRNIVFFLSTNSSEIGVILLAIILGFPSPFSAIQILWINLITDGTTGIALAMEPKHHDILKLSPRPKNEFLNHRNLMQMLIMILIMTVGVLGFYFWALSQDKSLEYARTGAFSAMIFLQIFNILNSQSLHTSIFKSNFFRNPYILASIFLSLVLYYFTIATRFGQELFQTTNLDIQGFIVILAISLTIILAIELEKFIWQKKYGRDY